VTRAEADALVEALRKELGLSGPGLNAAGLSAVTVGEAQLAFAFRAETQALEVSALLYRFRARPRPQVLEGFRRAEREKWADTGGGRLDYQPESQGLFLTRRYAEAPEADRFAEEVAALVRAGEVWRTEVLQRVADGVTGF
jgi:hypothetical protein